MSYEALSGRVCSLLKTLLYIAINASVFSMQADGWFSHTFKMNENLDSFTVYHLPMLICFIDQCSSRRETCVWSDLMENTVAHFGVILRMYCSMCRLITRVYFLSYRVALQHRHRCLAHRTMLAPKQNHLHPPLEDRRVVHSFRREHYTYVIIGAKVSIVPET